MTLFLVTHSAYAVTTLYVGRTFAGYGTTNDYNTPSISLSGKITNSVLDFTNISEIKKIKIDVDYESGDFEYTKNMPSLELWDVQVGFPVITNDKGLVYVTLGAVDYNEYHDTNPKHSAIGNMLGINIVATPTDRFQFEADCQRSLLGGSSKLYSDAGELDNYPDITAVKLKVQYVLTDNFGLAIHYRYLQYQIKNSQVTAVDLNTTSFGFIYRF